MKIWVSKNSDVPIQEQLSTQLILGIVSADLQPGERLPSTTQIGRQFHIHANTVRASYRDLADRGWLEWRAGSGFYVRPLTRQPKLDPEQNLDHLISAFLEIARTRGHSLSEIQSRIQRWLTLQKPDHVLVIEPDPELRQILMAEIAQKISLPVQSTAIAGLKDGRSYAGEMCVALYDHANEIRQRLPAEVSCLMLHSRSIAKVLLGQKHPGKETIITVISRWPDFLHWARTTLVAVGIDTAALDIRDGRKKGWNRGLNAHSFIITDCVIGSKLPSNCKPRVFRMIADESIEEIRQRL